MPSKVDTLGIYRGLIKESVLGLTKENRYPSWNAAFDITERYIHTEDDIAHYELDEAGWVDWTVYEEEVREFFCLFTANLDKGEQMVPGENDLFNYQSLQNATGWDGTEFESLQDDSFLGKTVLLVMKDDEYKGKERVVVARIDDKDAPPLRELAKMDTDEVKKFSALLVVQKTKAKPAKPSKAAKKPTTETKGAPVPDEQVVEEKATPEPAAEKTPPKTKAKKRGKPPAQNPVEIKEADEGTLSTEPTQIQAWNIVINNKGDNTDPVIGDAWTDSVNEVGPDKDEDSFTGEDWASVRDLIIKDLSLEVTNFDEDTE